MSVLSSPFAVEEAAQKRAGRPKEHGTGKVFDSGGDVAYGFVVIKSICVSEKQDTGGLKSSDQIQHHVFTKN